MILLRRARRMLHMWWHVTHLEFMRAIDVYELWGHSDPELIRLECECGKQF